MKRINWSRARVGPILATAAMALFLASCSHTQTVRSSAGYNAPSGAAGTVQQSNLVMQDFASRTGQQIPPAILERAAGIMVIPNLTKAAFIGGGSYGTGILSSCNQNQWSLPVFTSIAGASIGFQIGITNTDLVLVFQNPKAVRGLEEGATYNLGADVTVAAGPVGANADVRTVNADVLAYRRTEGAFAGVSLSGDRVHIDGQKTLSYYEGASPQSARAYYGQPDDFVRRVLDHQANIQNPPPEAKALQQTLGRVSR